MYLLVQVTLQQYAGRKEEKINVDKIDITNDLPGKGVG